MPAHHSNPARHPLRLLGAVAALLSFAAGLPLPAARAAAPSPALLQSLEAALNASDASALAAVLEAGPGFDPAELQKRHRTLRELFPQARWRIVPAAPLRDGRPTVNLTVTGERQEGPFRYRLEATQQLALESNGTRINGQSVLREQSILRSGEAPLPVSLQIPDAVLTGQRYDVDVIFDDPLDGAVVAGGLVAVPPSSSRPCRAPICSSGPSAAAACSRPCRRPSAPAPRPGRCCWCTPRAS